MATMSIYDETGAQVLSPADYGGLTCEMFVVAANTTVTKTYPNLAGRTIAVEVMGGDGTIFNMDMKYTISYPSSIPTIVFASLTTARIAYVWTK